MTSNYEEAFKDIMDLVRGNNQIYQAVGKCIYCGSSTYSEDKKRLSDEHIIPYSLAGKLLLKEASCKTCSDKTSSFERICARDLYVDMRTHFRLPTRRPNERPTELPLGVEEEGEFVNKLVALDNHPFVFMMPKFQRAGILTGRAAEKKFSGVGVIGRVHYPPGLVPASPAEFVGPNFSMTVKLQFGTFTSLIAKIAHSFAVAELGLNAFKPMLLDVISGKCDHIPYLIGSLREDSEILENKLHVLKLFEHRTSRNKYVVCHVRLFGPIEFPIYEAVVGTVGKSSSIHTSERSQP